MCFIEKIKLSPLHLDLINFIKYRVLNQTPSLSYRREDLKVRSFSRHDSLDELTSLINKAYSIYTEMGLNYMAVDQTQDVTARRIRKGLCLVVWQNSKIIGTITYKPPWKCKGSPWYRKKDVAKFNQLAVDPNVQQKGIGGELLELTESIAKAHGAKELALDTSENAVGLIEYYKKRGYRFIEFVNWNSTNYRSVIMSKTL